MKLLIIANNCPWKTWEEKIQQLKEWFLPKIDLTIEIKHTQFKDVPFEVYQGVKAGVAHAWYDENVSKEAAAYDIVMLVMNVAQWQPALNVRGWRTDHNNGPVELQVAADEYENLYWGGQLIMSSFLGFATHEILHALFLMTGEFDTVHYWWGKGEFKKPLEEINFETKNYKIYLIQQLIFLYKKWMGLLESAPQIMYEAEQDLLARRQPESMQSLVRRVCLEEGLGPKLAEQVYRTIQCESGFNPRAINKNVNSSTDYGICQFNDGPPNVPESQKWWIGKGKAIPSKEVALNDPEYCVRIMCREFKKGNAKYWVCFNKIFG